MQSSTMTTRTTTHQMKAPALQHPAATAVTLTALVSQVLLSMLLQAAQVHVWEYYYYQSKDKHERARNKWVEK